MKLKRYWWHQYKREQARDVAAAKEQARAESAARMIAAHCPMLLGKKR